MSIREIFENDVLYISDGATGTNLQARGLETGQPSETWLIERPDEIAKLHSAFIDAGSDILLTNTFGCNSIRLSQYDLGDKVKELNFTAVELARKSIDERRILLAGSIGPTGQMLKPLGNMEEKDAVDAYAGQAAYLIEAGVDFVVIETQYDLAEAILAIQAVKSIDSHIPVVCSFSYDRGTRTMMGVRPGQMAKEIAPLGVDMLGINCGKSIEDNMKCLEELHGSTSLPIWFKPNAGLPDVNEDGKAVYDITPDMMGSKAAEWIKGGAKIVGGCCGTSPQHLEKIARMIKAN